jgi:hypothetical protein
MNKMKLSFVSLFLFSAVLLFAPSLRAQDSEQENNSRLGIKAGINVANLFANDVVSSNALLGFNGGVFLKIAINQRFAFQPELLFSTQGAELEYNNSFVTGTVTYHLNYLQVPLVGVYNVTRNINIQGGIYLASLLSTQTKNGADDGSFNFEEQISKSNFQSIDYGLLVGLGADLNRISFGIRYNYGVSNIGKEFNFSNESIQHFPDARNSVFQGYMGFSIL